MGFTVVIPARHASTRLPGKMLLNLGGKPMIQHVYERAEQSGADRVIVATDHQAIVDAVNRFSGEVLLTAESHQSGT
ncbi:cytidylyltransferase domain-containing protein, partial [Kaarinaea lacus]